MTLTIGLHGVPGPGVSHDHGVAVMRNGHVLFCRELERETGVKHDGRLADHVEELIRPWLVGDEPVRFALANSFAGANFVSAGGALEICGAPDLAVPEMIVECAGKLLGCGRTRAAKARFFTVCHEIAHVGTCLPFFGPFAPGSLLVHIDGGASRSCASAWHYDGRTLSCLDHGWRAGLKTAVNNFNASHLSRRILGLSEADHLAMPGKLMGLASYGPPHPGASEWLANHGWLQERPEDESAWLLRLRNALPSLGIKELSTVDSGCQSLAACMQRNLEDETLRYIRRFQEETGARHLYYSGGAALNIHANARIEKELGFHTVFIPPAPSDAGLALGAAAFGEWQAGSPMRMHSAFLNHLSSKPEEGGAAARLPVLTTPAEAAQAIADSQIIGVWVGDAEVGPRALGRRSILARPDSIPLRRRLSEEIKQREWYRPVAPMMLSEVASRALVGYKPGSALGAYMLGAWSLESEWAEAFRGCAHADGSVRAQVISGSDKQLRHIHACLKELRATHGIHGMINTSFNRKGRSIVQNRDSAMRAAQSLELDALWLPA